MRGFRDTVIRLRPLQGTSFISRGRIVVATGNDGYMRRDAEHGVIVHETRMICTYGYRIDSQTPEPVTCSNIAMHHWLGHYIMVPPGHRHEPADEGSGMMTASTEHALELRVDRQVTQEVVENLTLTNFTQRATSFEFEIEIDGDFADIQEVRGERRQRGDLTREWTTAGGRSRLDFSYHARHEYDVQGHVGTAEVLRRLAVEIRESDSAPAYSDGSIRFAVTLEAGGRWRAQVGMVPKVEADQAAPPPDAPGPEELTRLFLQDAACYTDSQDELAPVVFGTLRRARHDLAGLRMFDLDRNERSWTMAAGLPIYVALYGRDALTASWQAAVLGPEMMEGTLSVIAEWQGREVDDWRDEQPGRMIHEVHTGPLKVLNYFPTARNYGSITTSAFYPVIVSELWHWTGDRDRVRPFVGPALAALRYLDEKCDHNGDGFYDYLTKSSQGVRHQAWKDSPDAIVDASGKQVEPPISAVEEQGFVYAAKLQLSEVLWWLGEKDDAKRLYNEADDLKNRFNEVFWMEEEGFYAAGLDSDGQPIRAITSNPGHAIATAIVDQDRAERTARRLFEDDLFSGWGVRTLSDRNPAYNPYSYHRGSVWPVEQGTFALGFMRYGLHDLTERLSRAQFEAAALFELHRLPEVFSGHARSAEQPFPAFYPQANTPQAWSSSAMFCLIQALLSLYPYAPLNMLLLDPHLPEWLPDITLENVRVGKAKATIRFHRKSDGSTTYKVEHVQGKLHILRQPSPWSLTAGFGERIKDAMMSLLPGK